MTKLLLFVLLLGQKILNPFGYDLQLTQLEGKNSRTMICFHGYGGSYEISSTLQKLPYIDASLVSFNFPEHNLSEDKEYNPKSSTFGTINEILPALYVLKKTVLDTKRDSIDLYGFSAGGGVLINIIAILNTSRFDKELETIGIGFKEKKQLLEAIEKGIIILDTPLKSVEEIIACRGSTEELEILAKKYRENKLRPIDSLVFLKELSLDILLHFQEEDEILSNRDDNLYIERLKSNQQGGKVRVIFGRDGGHTAPHISLWEAYLQVLNENPE